MAAAVAKAIALPGEPAPKAIAFEAPMPFHPSRHLKRVEGCGAGAQIQRQAIGSLNFLSAGLQTIPPMVLIYFNLYYKVR